MCTEPVIVFDKLLSYKLKIQLKPGRVVLTLSYNILFKKTAVSEACRRGGGVKGNVYPTRKIKDGEYAPL